jgi:hypothetical protein
MLTFRWTASDRERALPRHTRRLVAAVRAGRGGALFPPVLRACPEGVETCARELAGDRDARLIAGALARAALAPLVMRIEQLGAWCDAAASRCAGLLGPRLLAVDNAALFGPVLRDGFAACAAGGDGADDSTVEIDDDTATDPAIDAAGAAHRVAAPAPHTAVDAALDALFGGTRRTLARFLRRLARDLDGPLGAAGARGPVRELWTAPDETHNGGERVIRARFRAGGAWAYKPRPATGERMLIADRGSLFARLNALPAAARAVRLPTLRVVAGSGRDRRAYSWQEWIERPREWGTIRRSRRGDLALAACRLAPRDAERFWHRAGALAAACFAFGASDLHTGNLVVGRRRAARAAMAYPVDLEIALFPVARLADTGLIAAEHRGGHDRHGDAHDHVGFERLARWCTIGGPSAGFVEHRGGLALRRRTRAWARRETSSIVADTRGRIGFGAYAAAYLRGMFDLWTKLVCDRAELTAALQRAARDGFVRVVLRSTADYAAERDRRMLAPGTPAAQPLSPEERAQLARLDVPYFFRRATGGPLLWIDPATGAHRTAGRQPAGAPRQPPSPTICSGERFALLELGVALRDALTYVRSDLPRRRWRDRRRGVTISISGPRRGSVAFDWHRASRRVTYAWRGSTITVDVAALDEAAP